jgi:hypothetical protein
MCERWDFCKGLWTKVARHKNRSKDYIKDQRSRLTGPSGHFQSPGLRAARDTGEMQNGERRGRGSRGSAHQRWGGRERPRFGGGRQPAHGSAYKPWWHSGASLATGRGGGCEVCRAEPQSSASLLQRIPRPSNRRREPLHCSARVDGMWPEKSAVVLRRLTRDGSRRWSCGMALWSSLRRRPAPVAPLGSESTGAWW